MTIQFDYMAFTIFYLSLGLLAYFAYRFAHHNPSQKILLELKKMTKSNEQKHNIEIEQNNQLNNKLDTILNLLKP